jgi:NhaP-type Na+/H+ or K+/H+ antiporter
MTRPCRRITLHLSQIFLTLGLTFTSSILFSVALPAAAGSAASLVAVDDAAAGQVVRRQLDHHPVLGEDPDVVLTHLAADVCEDPVSVLQLHAEHRVRQGLDDPAFDLDRPVLLGHVLRVP